jgi:hypothetical protein
MRDKYHSVAVIQNLFSSLIICLSGLSTLTVAHGKGILFIEFLVYRLPSQWTGYRRAEAPSTPILTDLEGIQAGITKVKIAAAMSARLNNILHWPG